MIFACTVLSGCFTYTLCFFSAAVKGVFRIVKPELFPVCLDMTIDDAGYDELAIFHRKGGCPRIVLVRGKGFCVFDDMISLYFLFLSLFGEEIHIIRQPDGVPDIEGMFFASP